MWNMLKDMFLYLNCFNACLKAEVFKSHTHDLKSYSSNRLKLYSPLLCWMTSWQTTWSARPLHSSTTPSFKPSQIRCFLIVFQYVILLCDFHMLTCKLWFTELIQASTESVMPMERFDRQDGKWSWPQLWWRLSSRWCNGNILSSVSSAWNKSSRWLANKVSQQRVSREQAHLLGSC